MKTALFVTIAGAILLFAVNPSSEKLKALPWLNVRDLGWILFLSGTCWAIAYTSPHYHRWRTRRIREEEDE